MHHECFGGLLERLYGLRLPAEGLAVDGEEGDTDFADLVWEDGLVYSVFVCDEERERDGGRHTSLEKGNLRSRRSVVRW